jgi:hypothetical protein
MNLPNNKKIGVIGAGQLGKMLAEAASPWNIKFNFLDAKNSPAERHADKFITGNIKDKEDIKALCAISDIVTFEIEHIDSETLFEVEKEGKKIFPLPSVLKIIKDKGIQKEFYKNNNIPVPHFVVIKEEKDWILHLDEFKGIDFKSGSGFVIGAGSLHASGNLYEVAIGSPYDIDDAPKSLIDLLKKPERHRAAMSGTFVDISEQELADMLAAINPDCDHETWYRCGMAVHEVTAGTGFDIWNNWSSLGQKYPGRDTLEKRWFSFGKSTNPVTIGTLKHYAEQAGWRESVIFTDQTEWLPINEANPLDLSGIDLLRPPGFVGDVADWINKQCIFPRENLAVAAALMAVSN